MSLFDVLTRASIRLGLEPITSFESDPVDTQVWAAIWEPNLLQALSSNTWNFATKVQELGRLIDTPDDPRYLYHFNLPSDFESPRRFLDSSGRTINDYRVEDRRLLANWDRVLCEYGRAYTMDDVGDLPSWFVAYWCSSLANEAAERLVAIGSVKQAIAAETQMLFQKAKVRDAQLAPPLRIGPSRWRSVR